MVFQGRNPAHYELESTDDIVMADMIPKDMFSAN